MITVLHPHNPIFIVDDEEEVIRSTELVLRAAGYNNFHGETDPRRVYDYLDRNPVECVLLDLALPHIKGEDLLVGIRNQHPEVSVAIVTSADDVETAVRCMRLGARDYIVKPFERTKLVCLISHLSEISELKRENEMLRDRLIDKPFLHPEAFAEIITQNEKMISICKYLDSSAASEQPILLYGETGVGKELFARAVHAASGRKGPFVAVNLAGIDEIAFTDTLFGHRRGAFTGADQARQGLLKNAEGGTLFLDEIGDLGLQSQVKLLRVLQENEYFPLGSDVPQRSEARVVMATNVDLLAAVERGDFRKDLYYRISTHRVTIPPLRERLDDIPSLVAYAVELSSAALRKKVSGVPSELISLLQNYGFPGNVRELQAMVHNAVAVHGSGTLSLETFRDWIHESWSKSGNGSARPVGIGSGENEAATESPEDEPQNAAIRISGKEFPTLKTVEAYLIEKAMERAGRNQGIAAAMLGISRQTLNGKLRTANSTLPSQG